jgi:hypothetical protein
MRNQTIKRTAWLLAAWALLTPGRLWAGADDAAGYAPPDFQLPLPLYSTRPEAGGLFVDGGYVMYRQSNPLREQLVAIRGFQVVDFSIPPIVPGQFIGDRAPALDVNQIRGPGEYQPGFKVAIGYRFEDESALTLSWMYLLSHRTTAFATPLPPNGNTGLFLEDSFLFSPVVNVPLEFSGQQKISQGNPGALFGIWNGASQMYIEFLQRTQMWDLNYRFPVYDTECYRLNGLVGPRFFWIWERFKWRTVDVPTDAAGNVGIPTPVDVGIFTNITSNRMYGPNAGCEQEWYLGHGFACVLDLEAALYLDIIKERQRFELGDHFAGPVDKRSRTDYRIAPELQATLSLQWYPTEGIQMQIGYDVMAFFNTAASRQPIAFDMSALDAHYLSTFRLFDGLTATIAFVF